MKDGKPFLLVEVKCPYNGKSNTISEILPKIKYLKIGINNEVIFKQKHEYYCQIQMEMAVLNIQSTDFIVFASFDSSFAIVNVPFNENYITNVLCTVKKCFCDHMIKYLCLSETENIPYNNSNLENK